MIDGFEVNGRPLRYWVLHLMEMEQTVFVNSASAAQNSIVSGSLVTGAPQLPVDTGNLRNGVQLEFDAPNSALIHTNVAYAEDVEDNVRGVTFRVGGPHGWKLTRAGFPRIVADETAKAAA